MGLFDIFRKSKDEPKPKKDSYTAETSKPWEVGYKILNRYEIMDIKKGGMGIVYIAHDHEWNQIFAVKTFQDKFLWDEDSIARFMAEAETWTELERHTNIVFANFILEIEKKPLIFLEYMDGGDLNRFIGSFDIPSSLDFAIQFCNGMEYAYNKLGVIHRDIKPGNVMISTDKRFKSGYAFKITDFGLAKALGEEFSEEFVEISTGMGTLPFMPPEQFPEHIQRKFGFGGTITTKTDVYSFGVTFYQLLTGKLPFTNIAEIFEKHPESPRTLNPDIPEELDRLIMRCLKKNPQDRYNDFRELKEELIRIYNDLTGEKYVVIGKKEPFTGVDWSNKGVALGALGKYHEAIECFDKALDINPRHELAIKNKEIALSLLHGR